MAPTPKQVKQCDAVFDLPGAIEGQVVVRFPPEPSGYLHIGHAKAALMNQYMKDKYHGKLIMRFDDTNPSLEKAEFEDAIKEDVATLGVVPDIVTYTSDYFDKFMEQCTKMINEGLLYLDNTPVDDMRQQRGAGIESSCRENSLEDNLKHWKEMQTGSDEGIKWVVRAKMDMKDKNKCMRDPVFYRCNIAVPHHRTGTKYKVYPTYDFACPLIDSWEGVTHAMRTNEYADRIPQYEWVQDKAGVTKTIVYEFSRLNLVNTCLSKRKLQWIVDSGIVTSWDDPRFPTIRAIRRRGLTHEAMLDFILQQGASKNSNLMEWDKLWACNKKVLDPRVPRWAAVSNDGVEITIEGVENTIVERDLHPKNADVGKAKQYRSTKVKIDVEDAASWKEGEQITLLKYGNLVIKSKNAGDDGKIINITATFIPDGDFKKTKKFHWVPVNADEKPIDIDMIEYDHLILKAKIEDNDNIEDIINRDSVVITKGIADPVLRHSLKVDDIIQFERRGLFRCDAIVEGRYHMIMIPEGKHKNMSVVSSKIDAKHMAKGGEKNKQESTLPVDDPSRINLVVGKIVKVWEHPDAEKLWCEEIDIGTETRCIASGLRDFYTQEQMLNRLVIVVANLAPKKLRGFESHGMVLCASVDGKVEFMTPPEGSQPGDRATFDGHNDTPDAVLPKNEKKSPWVHCQKLFSTNSECVGQFNDKKLTTSKGEVKCNTVAGGTMS